MAGDRISYEVDFSAKGLQTLWNEFLAGSESAGRALNQALGGRVKKEVYIETVVDDNGVKKLVAREREVLTELQKIINLQEKANETQYGSVTSLRQQVNQAKKVRDGMVKYASATDGISGRLGTINEAWTIQNQRVKDLQRQLDIAGASNIWQRLTAEYNLGGLASAGRQITELVNVFQSVSIVVGQVIGSVNQLFDALQRLQSIKLTFQGIGAGGDIGTVFSESSRIALGLGVNLNTVRDAFQQLSPVILATGGNIGNVSAVTEALSSRFITFGLSADKSRRVMNGVVQAFSKGKLMAEELTQQISEADPAFRTDLAEAVGVSVKELGEMVKAGQITNQVLLEAIPKMSKAAGLFGKLGVSALDAAKAFRDGAVTVEQFRAQLGNIEQLALEDLVNPDTGPLQPLLASLAELRAVVTDVVVAFAGSEVFETFLDLLGQVASVASVVVQAIVKIGSVIASIGEIAFRAINFIDSLGGTLKGFGIISTTVAAVIVTKLIASLVVLGSGAIVGAATAAINGLTAALTLLNAKGLGGLLNNIATAIVQLLGLSSATAVSTGAQVAATASTGARATATAFLSKVLGIQAAKEALLAAASNGAAAAQVRTAGGILITGAAATTATPAVGGLAAATTSLAAAAAAVLAPLLLLTAAIGAVVAVALVWNAATKEGSELSSKFGRSFDAIKAGAEATKKAIDEGGKSTDEFTKKIKELEIEREKAGKEFNLGNAFNLALAPLTSGASLLDPVGEAIDLVRTTSLQGLALAAAEVTGKILKETTRVTQAVYDYDKANDKAGTNAKRLAVDLVAAQAGVTSALELTRAKREEILKEEAKNKKPTSAGTLQALKDLDAEIKRLEEVERIQAAIRAEAREKGIEIDVNLDIKDAEALLDGFGEKVKGLRSRVILETDPGKRAQLQGELNALKGFLEFLEGDITEITIEAIFKVDQRALKDTDALAKATLDKYKAIADYAQAVYEVKGGQATGREKDAQAALDVVKERLEKEKEARTEAIKEAKDRGESEFYIKKLEKEAREADKAGREEVRNLESNIKDIAEEKKEIERQALQAKKDALPAQQAAERESLKIQQDLARLELERTKNAATRAKNEAILLRTKVGNEISQARLDKDKEKEKILKDQYNLLGKNIELLNLEESSLKKSGSSMEKLFQTQRETLDLQQQSTSLGLDAQLAALGTADAQGKIAGATQATAAAGSNSVSNARQLQQLAKDAAAYADSGAAAARQEADARGDALQQLAGQVGQVDAAAAAANGAVGGAEQEVDNAATNADDFSSNLKSAASWATDVANTLTQLDGTEVNFSVAFTGAQGLWTGGPTVGGQTYRINELGQEGFLSSTGTLSQINKPRNALWKAPGKGMVIPAHIMSTLDIPTGRVSTGVRPAAIGSGGNGMSRIVRAIQNALIRTSAPDPGIHEMASVQAHQAQQIGKLSRAVTKLADKDWNVNVGVRNTGSTAYLDALNRRM